LLAIYTLSFLRVYKEASKSTIQCNS